MVHSDIQEKSIVLACTALCLLAAAIGWFVSPGALTLPLALVSLVPPLSVSFVRAARNGIVDPLAVFALCFAAYNGFMLVRLESGADMHGAAFATGGTVLFQAGILSGLGSLGVITGWLLLERSHPEEMRYRNPSPFTAAFPTGVVFYIVGIVLYVLQYWQLGGYMRAVAMDRGQRWEMLAHTVSLPYDGFVVSGLSLMLYASISRPKPRLMLTCSACLVWLVLVLLQGDRRLALQLLMALGVVVGTLRPKVMRLRPLALAWIVVGYSAAIVFGEYRELIYDLAAGRSTLKQSQVAAETQQSVMGKPEESELGGPYVSVLYYARGSEPLRWGLSYVSSIPAFLPRVLYPGEKVPPITSDLDLALHVGQGPVYGLGFSPIAESFANFGLPGPFVGMVLWSMLFGWLGVKRHRSLGGMLLCANLLQEAVNSNRIDFRYVWLESFFCVVTVLLALLCMRVLEMLNRAKRGGPYQGLTFAEEQAYEH